MFAAWTVCLMRRGRANERGGRTSFLRSNIRTEPSAPTEANSSLPLAASATPQMRAVRAVPIGALARCVRWRRRRCGAATRGVAIGQHLECGSRIRSDAPHRMRYRTPPCRAQSAVNPGGGVSALQLERLAGAGGAGGAGTTLETAGKRLQVVVAGGGPGSGLAVFPRPRWCRWCRCSTCLRKRAVLCT